MPHRGCQTVSIQISEYKGRIQANFQKTSQVIGQQVQGQRVRDPYEGSLAGTERVEEKSQGRQFHGRDGMIWYAGAWSCSQAEGGEKMTGTKWGENYNLEKNKSQEKFKLYRKCCEERFNTKNATRNPPQKRSKWLSGFFCQNRPQKWPY